MSLETKIIGPITIFFVLLTVVSIIFPSLFSSIFGNFSDNLIPYELGILGIPVIISNLILLTFGILYYKQKLPVSISNCINLIRTYEIPKKPCILVLVIIFSVYIALSSPELLLDEYEQWPDYRIVELGLEIWPDGESENIYVQEQNDRYVRMFLLKSSIDLFQNIKILPFLASILVILFTYLLTVQITEKRFAGLISILVLIHSHTFLRFDTIAVYENFWVLFYLISLYTIKKQWILSPIFYTLSFFTKAFVAPYFIMTLFFATKTSISTKKKLALLIAYGAVIGIFIMLIFSNNTIYSNVIQIDTSKFFLGIANLGPLLRFDFFLLFTILPVVFGLTFLFKTQSNQASQILFLILGSLIAGPILIVFTNFYEILPYRYIPLLIFFAIGIGLFFSKKSNS